MTKVPSDGISEDATTQRAGFIFPTVFGDEGLVEVAEAISRTSIRDCPANKAALGEWEANRVRSAVLAADDTRYAAMLAGDLQALNRLLADELLYTHSSGTTEDKSQYLNSLASGRVKYHRARRKNERMSVSACYAVMSGLSIVDARVDSVEKHLRNHFTATWICKTGQWQLLSWASTPVQKA